MGLAQAARSFSHRSMEYVTNCKTRRDLGIGYLRTARLQLGMIPGAIGVDGGEFERSIPDFERTWRFLRKRPPAPVTTGRRAQLTKGMDHNERYTTSQARINPPRSGPIAAR